MDLELIFEPNQKNIKNLTTLSLDEYKLSELRICEIAEMSDTAADFLLSLYNSGMSIDEMLSVLSDTLYQAFYKIDTKSIVEENKAKLELLSSLLSVSDRAFFCELVFGKLKHGNIEIKESDFFKIIPKAQTFIYVKNALSDEAYDVFSQNFSDPRLKYANNLRDAVKAVVSKEIGYCLLPLEERDGVRLPTVAELIFANDLKIISVIPVFGMDGNADMKYALVSTSLDATTFNIDDDRYFEIRMAIGGSLALAELLEISKMYDILPYRINTITFNTEDGKIPYYSIVLKGEGKDFSVLLTYLTLFSNDFTLVGIYSNLE